MRFLIIFAAAAFIPAAVQAELIDFDATPGAMEGLEITNQFEAAAGVVFEFGSGGPVLGRVGPPRTAFSPNDVVNRSEGIGEFFLTDDGLTTGLILNPITMRYTREGAAEVSGQVIDLDFEELLVIEALDITGSVIDTVTLAAGAPEAGNRLATPWSVTGRGTDIWAVTLSGTAGPAGVFYGVGFDLIETGVAAVPLPPAAVFLGSGLLVLLGRRRRSRATAAA